jgi:four helix bundle protein
MSENIVLDKSYAFALRIVRLYKFLNTEKNEFVLSKQVLLAGTYIGVHVKNAEDVESKNAFVNEMATALKKASETEYWLELLHESDYLEEKAFKSIVADCIELKKLLVSIVKTSRTTTA